MSHASEDRPLAASVAKSLRSGGIRPWLDRDHLVTDAGHELAASRIETALDSITDFVAIVSRRARTKPWVVHEWQSAAARWLATGHPAIHVVLDGSTGIPAELPAVSVTPAARLGSLSDNIRTVVAARELDASALDELTMRVRTEFLIGGASAVRALHGFDAAWPVLADEIDRAAETEFDDPERAVWLRRLGPLIDLRVDRGWARSAYAAALTPGNPVDIETKAIIANNLGVLEAFAGAWNAATRRFAEALAMCEREDDLEGVLLAHGNLALTCLEAQDWAGASEALSAWEVVATRRSDAMHDQMGPRALYESHQGRLAAAQGKADIARLHALEHLRLGTLLEQPRQVAAALGFLARDGIDAGRYDAEHQRMLDRYRSMSVTLLNPRGFANANRWQARGEAAQGRISVALTLLDEEVDLRRHLQEHAEQQRALVQAVEICPQPNQRSALAQQLAELRGDPLRRVDFGTLELARIHAALSVSGRPGR